MTANSIQAASPGSQLWDKGQPGSVTGLHVRVLSNGRRIFYLYYRTRQGKQRRPKIGEFGQCSLSDARRRAKAIMDVVSVGSDPKGDWDLAKEELFIQELFQEAWEKHWGNERFLKSGWAQEVKNLYERHIAPEFGILRLSEVTPTQVADWLNKRRKTPIAANRALEVLSRMFRFAEERCWVKSNPCKLVRSFSERKRARFASPEEIGKLGAAIKEEQKTNPRGAAFLYLLILSGSRPSAIERATWDQVERVLVPGKPYVGILRLDGKNTGRHGAKDTIVIPTTAMELLDSLPSSDGTLTGCKLPRKMWARVKQKAGCPDLWARDWRRTFATVGLSGGLEVGLIGELLNHKSTQTTSTYAKLLPHKRIAAAQEISSRLESMLGVSNVARKGT